MAVISIAVAAAVNPTDRMTDGMASLGNKETPPLADNWVYNKVGAFHSSGTSLGILRSLASNGMAS